MEVYRKHDRFPVKEAGRDIDCGVVYLCASCRNYAKRNAEDRKKIYKIPRGNEQRVRYPYLDRGQRRDARCIVGRENPEFEILVSEI